MKPKKYTSKNSWETISLHDCDISDITLTNNSVSFQFEEGFWVTPNNKYSQSKQTIRTRQARMTAMGMGTFKVVWAEPYSVSKIPFPKETVNQSLEETLVDNIRNNRWRVEINSLISANQQMEINCYIYMDYPPHNSALTICFDFHYVEYCWDKFNFNAVF